MKNMDLIGQKFGRLIPLEKWSIKRRTYYKCKCDCGNEKFIYRNDLKRRDDKAVKSCGCLQKEKASESNYKHGCSSYVQTKEYNAWCSMKYRCYNKNFEDYHRYGGRGIKVCERWLNSFENFLTDVGFAPSPDHSIDRIDNDGHYEPGNVRWATKSEQASNRSTSKHIFI